MSEFYKYRQNSKQLGFGKAEFVKQMLNTQRDETFGCRLPKKLKDKLNQENRPANIVIELLAQYYYSSTSTYDQEAWEEEIKEW